MKKILSMLIALSLIIVLAACNKETKSSEDTAKEEKSSSETEKDDETKKEEEQKEEKSEEKTDGVAKNATIEESVLYDQNGIKITATGLNYDSFSVDLNLLLENNSDKEISVMAGTLGHNCNSVNGYMVDEGYLNVTLPPGKKANEAVKFDYNLLSMYGIKDIADIEMNFEFSDKDYNKTYSGPCVIKTSLNASHDYSPNYYQNAISDSKMAEKMGYTLDYFAEDSAYDTNGIKHLSTALVTNRQGEHALLLEFENTTSEPVVLYTYRIFLNNLLINNGSWSIDSIGGGKKGVVDINLTSIVKEEFWEELGIKGINTVALEIEQATFDKKEGKDRVRMDLNLSDSKAVYEIGGKELYNKDGISVFFKSIVRSTDEYDKDTYLYIVAENKSDKVLMLDDVYESLSVNGFMTDNYFYGVELKEGEKGLLQIKLDDEALKTNKVEEISDIKDIDFKLRIKENYDDIAEVPIKITF